MKIIDTQWKIKVTTSIDILVETVADVLWTAFYGGGSYYWAFIESETPATGNDFTYEEAKPIQNVLNGGTITFHDNEDRDEFLGVLSPESIRNGLHIMAARYPKDFHDAFVLEDYDANTADIFLQLCVMGDVVYG